MWEISDRDVGTKKTTNKTRRPEGVSPRCQPSVNMGRPDRDVSLLTKRGNVRVLAPVEWGESQDSHSREGNEPAVGSVTQHCPILVVSTYLSRLDRCEDGCFKAALVQATRLSRSFTLDDPVHAASYPPQRTETVSPRRTPLFLAVTVFTLVTRPSTEFDHSV